MSQSVGLDSVRCNDTLNMRVNPQVGHTKDRQLVDLYSLLYQFCVINDFVNICFIAALKKQKNCPFIEEMTRRFRVNIWVLYGRAE